MGKIVGLADEPQATASSAAIAPVNHQWVLGLCSEMCQYVYGHVYGHVQTWIDTCGLDTFRHVDSHVDSHVDRHVDRHVDGHVDSHVGRHMDSHVCVCGCVPASPLQQAVRRKLQPCWAQVHACMRAHACRRMGRRFFCRRPRAQRHFYLRHSDPAWLLSSPLGCSLLGCSPLGCSLLGCSLLGSSLISCGLLALRVA